MEQLLNCFIIYLFSCITYVIQTASIQSIILYVMLPAKQYMLGLAMAASSQFRTFCGDYPHITNVQRIKSTHSLCGDSNPLQCSCTRFFPHSVFGAFCCLCHPPLTWDHPPTVITAVSPQHTQTHTHTTPKIKPSPSTNTDQQNHHKLLHSLHTTA